MTLVSCKLEDRESASERETDFVVSAEIPAGVITYAAQDAFSHFGGAGNVNSSEYDLRYIMEVYDGDNLVCRDEKFIADGFSAGVDFKVRLIAKKYRFAFWADFVKEGQKSDNLYNTSSGLDDISYSDAADLQQLASDAADAYCHVEEIDLSEAGQTCKISMKRPFGKIRMLATDKVLDSQTERPVSVKVEFDGAIFPSNYNVLTGESSGSLSADKSSKLYFDAVHENASVNKAETEGYLLANFYVFASKPETAYGMDVTVYADKDRIQNIGRRSLSGIPVYANRLTTVVGNFYSNEGDITIVVEDPFENDNPNYITISSIEEVNRKLEEYSGMSSVPEKIGFRLQDETVFQSGTGINLFGLSSEITLELNGYEAEDGTLGVYSDSFSGVLKLNNTGGSKGTMIINLPAGDAEVSGSFGSLDVTTRENTFTVAEEAELNALTVRAGNVKIFGRVSPENISISEGSDSRIYWGAGDAPRLQEVLSYDASKNHGVILTSDITGATGTDGACFRINHNDYLFDGNGHSISGNSEQNVIVVGGDGVELRNLTVTQPSEGVSSNGISVYRAKSVKITDVTIHDCRKAAIIVNGSEVSATGLRTYGNAWGAVNVGKGSGVMETPEFAFDGTCVFEESNKVWVDCDEPWTVNAPEGWGSIEMKGMTLFGKGFPYTGAGSESDPKLIGNIDELQTLSQLVRAGNEFNGVFIKLSNDIDLGGVEWKPVGVGTAGKRFKGTFDGDGKTISNLLISELDVTEAGGFFGALNGTVRNLVIENVKIIHQVDGNNGGTGVVAGSIFPSESIENVTVRNAEVEGNRWVGGIAGYIYGTVTGCSVENTIITAVPDHLSGNYDNGDKAGGIVGYSAPDNGGKISGNTVTDIKIRGYRDLGGIAGAANAAALHDNTAKNVQITVDQKTGYYGTKDSNAETILGRILDNGELDESNVRNGNNTLESIFFVESGSDLNKLKIASNTTFYIQEGEYAPFSLYTYSKTGVSLIADGKVVINGSVAFGTHSNYERSIPESTLIKGFTIKGELKLSACGKLVAQGNTAAQLTVKTYGLTDDNSYTSDIDISDNIIDASLAATTPQKYGIYIVPNVTGYRLSVTGNTLKNIGSHALVIQGCGDGSSVTTPGEYMISGNVFESWGLENGDNRGAVKVWADSAFAPESLENGSISDLTEEARLFVKSVLDGNNSFPASLRENCCIFEFYGLPFDSLE